MRSQTNVKNAIVFANRKTTVALLETSLKRHGFNAAALHGDMDQSARLKTLSAFRAGEVTYLIASDVAARGLDIPEVSHVFNYDVPIHAEDYVHRVGRTGRAGREGHAFTMVSKLDSKHLKAIEQLIKKEIAWFGDTQHGRARGGAGREAQARSVAARRPRPSGSQAGRAHAQARACSEAGARSHARARARAAMPRSRSARQRDSGPRHLPDAPETGGFHSGNMPAFLARPVRYGLSACAV